MSGASESAEVVVVGAGAVGTATAFHLAELGITDVVLVERESLGAGSSGKSAGGFRLQFADELNLRIALRSVGEFESFAERFGVDIGLVQAGYLFLLDSLADVEIFSAALALQQSLGIPSTELTPAEAGEIVPQLALDGVLGATYCPRDGYLAPEAVVQGYAAAASARGVRVRQAAPLVGVEVRRGRIVGVDVADSRIATDTMVCAAGVWSRDVAGLAGIDLPVRGERRWMHFTPEDGGLPEVVPLTVDFGTGFYFHREGPGLVFGGRAETLDGLAAPAARRLPVLAELPVRSSWWGWYEMSPDHNALVGEAPEPSRFLYATGFSGHGFQQAPAVGEHLAELVAGRTPTLDLSPFRLERFAAGKPKSEHVVV